MPQRTMALRDYTRRAEPEAAAFLDAVRHPPVERRPAMLQLRDLSFASPHSTVRLLLRGRQERIDEDELLTSSIRSVVRDAATALAAESAAALDTARRAYAANLSGLVERVIAELDESRHLASLMLTRMENEGYRTESEENRLLGEIERWQQRLVEVHRIKSHDIGALSSWLS